MWFYQYKIELCMGDPQPNDPYNTKLVQRTGLVPGETFSQVIENLSQYYGELDITEILCLKPLFEDIIEFEDANNEDHFDYRIIRKEIQK